VSAAFAQDAQELGADIISLIVREKYFFDDQIFNHFKYVDEHSDLGILIHEMPFLSGLGGPPVNWPLSLLDRVADLPGVVAIKEDAKEDEFSHDVINLLKDRLSIVISGGGKRQWLSFAEQGCQAWLNGIGVFEPKLASTFYRNYKAGNQEMVQGLLKEVEDPFFQHGVLKYGWHLTIKAALEWKGLMSRQERLPMQALPQELADRVCEVMDGLPLEKYTRGPTVDE
jgi:4-hydroxy-tetrahydrodipicolinate synthase